MSKSCVKASMCFPPFLYQPKARKCSSIEGVVVVKIPPDPACRSAFLQSKTWSNSYSPEFSPQRTINNAIISIIYSNPFSYFFFVWCLQGCPRSSSLNTDRSVFLTVGCGCHVIHVTHILTAQGICPCSPQPGHCWSNSLDQSLPLAALLQVFPERKSAEL